MKRLIPVMLLLSVVLSCNDENTGPAYCGIPDPANNLLWLKFRINELKASGKSQYYEVGEFEIEGGTLFVFSNCCQNCAGVSMYYDCKGNPVQIYDYVNYKSQRTVWKPAQPECLAQPHS